MRIGIIGGGSIGGTAAELWRAAGHDVVVGSRSSGSVDEAAAHGEVVLVAIPFGAIADLPAGALRGKVVIDANNYYPARDGHVAALDDGSTTSSELLADALPGARIVKALNTMYFATLRDGGRPAGDPSRLALFVAGDDAEAKELVAGLVDDLGFDAVDTGGLAEGGRRQQPGTDVYNTPMTAERAREVLGDG